MKVAWIFPRCERCGIAIYSERYIEALRSLIDVECFDPADYCSNSGEFLSHVNTCDLVHIQYEPSFYFSNGSCFYDRLCEEIRKPMVVSLHEVYRQFPDVYPRDSIRGHGLLSMVKRWRYDRRHPVQTAYYRHAGRSFYAEKVFVHYDFQSAILREQRVRPDAIAVVPHPIPAVPGIAPSFWPDRTRPLHCAATGFINPHFDFNLLFAGLDRLDLLDVPWRFTWIGGPRHGGHEPLMERLRSEIDKRGWQRRFIITGWVDEAVMHRELASADIVFALFSSRSSSGSLAAALGAMRLVIATSIPLTEELSSRHGVLHLVPPSADGVATGIKQLIDDEQLRMAILTNVDSYSKNTDYAAMAQVLTNHYNRCMA